MNVLRPTESDLKGLKSPLGKLLRGEPKETIPRLKVIIQNSAPPFITAVGDIVSSETTTAGIRVNLRIVDQRTMRQPLRSQVYEAKKIHHVRNPAGVIAMDSWNTIKKAMNETDSLILVDGEEDLLALPCVAESVDRALVLYGQPSQGMVVVSVSPGIRAEVKGILKRGSKEEMS